MIFTGEIRDNAADTITVDVFEDGVTELRCSGLPMWLNAEKCRQLATMLTDCAAAAERVLEDTST